MTLLMCSKLSGKEDLSKLAERVISVFSNPENQIYFKKTCERKSKESAVDTLSSLLLLSDAIKELDRSFGEEKIDFDSLIFAKNEYGKPYFKDSNIKFNISHSSGHIAVALSDTSEVGVDIETNLPSDEKVAKISERFFDEDDRAVIKSHPSLFGRIWTQKEAESKLLGIALGRFFAESKAKNKDFVVRKDDRAVYFSFYEFCGHPVTLCRYNCEDGVIFKEIQQTKQNKI